MRLVCGESDGRGTNFHWASISVEALARASWVVSTVWISSGEPSGATVTCSLTAPDMPLFKKESG